MDISQIKGLSNQQSIIIVNMYASKITSKYMKPKNNSTKRRNTQLELETSTCLSQQLIEQVKKATVRVCKTYIMLSTNLT